MITTDFHTHMFPDTLAARAVQAVENLSDSLKACGDGTRAGLLAAMARAGIGRSVTLPVATRPDQVSSINLSACSTADPALVSFGTLHPLLDNPRREIDRLLARGVRGVKLHPEYQHFHVDDPSVFPLYSLLNEAGLIVVFHAGRNPGPFSSDHALPAAFAVVARRFPGLTMVLAHMGGFLAWERVIPELSGADVLLETSSTVGYLGREQFLLIVKKFGVERVLFGSDWPWVGISESVEWIDSMKFSRWEREMIMAGNAQRVLAG